MTKQEFIDKLYEIGWTSPCDSQHCKISELLDTIPHFAAESDLVNKNVSVKIVPFDGESVPVSLEVYGTVTEYDGDTVNVEATVSVDGKPIGYLVE